MAGSGSGEGADSLFARLVQLEANLAARLARLEAESAIRQLVAGYAFHVDDRNFDALRSLFAEDAVLRSDDGVMHAEGVEAIMAQFDGRFSALGAGWHVMHDVAILFDSEDEARGRVSGHAELWRNGQMMVAALGYRDRYRRTPSGWRIIERVIGFLYYVPVADYPGILGTTLRNRAYAEPRPADFPEPGAHWQRYHHPQPAS